MINFLFLILTLSCTLLPFVENSSEKVKINYEKLYKIGVDAYLQNRWTDCVSFIERSIEEYIYYHTVTISCRKKCERNAIKVFPDDTESSSVWRLQTLVTERAHCLMKCQKLYFPDRPKTTKEGDDDFEKKVPYNYLQLCYFKINELEKAASCAYTFLITNPNHEVMLTNLQYYMSLPSIKIDKVRYLEPKYYQDLFLKGAQLYMDAKYDESVVVMELSLKEYLSAEEDCRLLCEGPMPQMAMEELYISFTNHFTYSLRCKLGCREKLTYMYGQIHDQLFSSHYHYLQFDYYKIGRVKETCSAVASFLLFHPNDKTMLANKEFYSKQPQVPSDCFTPREEALHYHKRYKRERDMLKSIEKNFQFESTKVAEPQSLKPPPGLPDSKASRAGKYNLGKTRKLMSHQETTSWFKENKITTYLNEKQLNGTSRVAFLNLASKNECQQLMQIVEEGGVHGDGYNGKESPHTEFEMFEGLTVARAATLAQRGILDPIAAQLFLNISEKVRQAVEVYFDLETELFFSYTHLVCRTALPDSPEIRNDLSHPIHSDNCILTTSGKCLKEKPAYTWRDYSSILYLNEDFEGGEFIFAADKNIIQATVKPACGLTVAFSAGKENLHGVKAVKNGRRCALAMWYTLDPEHREKERDFAEYVLADLGKKRELSSLTTTEQSFSQSTLLKFLELAKKNHHHIHTEL